MNTGHEGGCGTVHANSTANIPARLEPLRFVLACFPTKMMLMVLRLYWKPVGQVWACGPPTGENLGMRSAHR